MLKEQLQKQIEQEAEYYAHIKFEETWHKKGLHRKTLLRYAHYDGAKKYAALYEAAEARAERAEKALRDFAEKLNEVCGQNGIITAGIHFIIDDMMMFPLTHKTGEDEPGT